MASSRGFAWWDTHHRAWRRARAWFVVAALVLTIYVVGLVVALAVPFAVAFGIEPTLDDVGGAGGLVATLLVLLLLTGAAIVAFGWRGTHAALRLARGRPPRGDEGRVPTAAVDAFAVAFGMRTPRVWVIDDDAPNALAFGPPADGHVCVTTGALGLPRAELVSLCRYEVTALASRTMAYATSAADLVLIGEWCVRLLWIAAAFVIVSAVVAPLDVLAAYVVGIAAVVVLTRPVLALAGRALVRLLDDTALLVDLETIRRSADPEAHALLLIELLEDNGPVASNWGVAHLWFERDVVEVDDGMPFLATLIPDIGMPFAERSTSATRHGLVRRARSAVDLATGDADLRERLAHAVGEPGRRH